MSLSGDNKVVHHLSTVHQHFSQFISLGKIAPDYKIELLHYIHRSITTANF